jgi:hypothetical protein
MFQLEKQAWGWAYLLGFVILKFSLYVCVSKRIPHSNTSTLEHLQPSPCIRTLQRGDTGKRGVRWML